MKRTPQTEKVVAVRVVRQEAEGGDNKLFFLFTAVQVEEVLSEVVTRPVPFAHSFLSGVAFWHGHLLPVIDLENRFAFSDTRKIGKSRFLVVRTGAPENPAGSKIFRCVLQLSENIHSIDAPDSSSIVNSEQLAIESSLVRGVYQWNDATYIVPDLVSILQNRQSSKEKLKQTHSTLL